MFVLRDRRRRGATFATRRDTPRIPLFILDYGHNHQFALPPSISSRSLPLPPNSSVFDRRQHSIRINNACAQVVRRYNSILNVIDGERNEIYQERVDPRGKLN